MASSGLGFQVKGLGFGVVLVLQHQVRIVQNTTAGHKPESSTANPVNPGTNPNPSSH